MFGAACLVLAAVPAVAQNIVQTFYVPLPDDQVRTALFRLQSGTGQTMDSVISIVVTGNNTRIYYDHWEDGFEVDLENPVQATSQVWGDGNLANGVAPGHPSDVLGTGDVIALRNLVPLPRNPSSVRFDGRDRFGATRALAVSRAAWATSPGTVLAGAVEVSSTRDFGTSFEVPVGQNVAASSMFEVVTLLAMAAENGTQVQVDRDGNGSVDITQTLNRGESLLVDGGILAGATLNASKPVQAHIITGDIGANYESRWYTLYPVSDWSNSYYSPVGTAADGDQTYIFLYNPGGAPLTVNYETRIGAGSVVVPAGGTTQYLMPQNSGAHFYSSGAPFFALATVGANPSANNVHDWGFSLVPESMLTTRAVVGWGPGSSDLSANGSPVWVTAEEATSVFVDYDGDPGTGLLGPDLNGGRYDVLLNLSAFESARVYDPDRDQTGMKLYTLNGTLITAAWGQDPSVAGAGNPFLDLGTTVLPLPVPIVTKSSRLVLDDGNPVPPGGNGLVDPPGDVLEYTITVSNEGVIVLGNIVVVDTPPVPLIYVPNSTTVNGVPIPDDVAPPAASAFPLDEGGFTIPLLDAGEETVFVYEATVLPGATSIQNGVAVDGGGEVITDDNTVPVNSPGVTSCTLAFTDGAGLPVGGFLPGQDVYVTVTDGDKNTNNVVAESIAVLVVDSTTGDAETVVLTETGVNTGIFRNTVGLPFSATTGQSTQDGTLYALAGNTLEAEFEDAVYGDVCSDTAAVSPQTETKHLYLSSDGSDGDTTGGLDRIDPVNVVPADATTSQTTVLGGSGTIAVDGTPSSSGVENNAVLSFAHTTGSGANRLTLVAVSSECIGGTCGAGPNNPVSSVTFDPNPPGAPLTNLTFVGRGFNSGRDALVEIWALMNAPASTTGTITVTNADVVDFVAGAINFSGVDLTQNLTASFVSNTGSGSGPTVNVPSAVGRLVFGVASWDEPGAGATPGAGQTERWDTAVTTGSGNDQVRGGASTEAGAASVTHSWTAPTSGDWAIGAVSIAPAPATTVATFTQSPVMAGNLTLPALTSVGVTTCIDVISGVMPGSPNITATVRRDATTIATINPTTYVASSAACNSGPALTWTSGALPSDVTVTPGQAINLEISTAEAGVSFEIEYDSNSRTSFIALPTNTVISVDSVAVYDAPYPGGSLVNTGFNGQTVYVRATVSDPFGAADITSLDLDIDDPLGGNVVTTTLTNSSVVASTGASKTYEYTWNTPGTDGVYPITVTAHEGYEGTITDAAATQITLSPQDLGTPSQTVFTTGLNGPHTLTYAPNEPVCIRVIDLDENTDPLTLQTISVVVTSSAGDSELVSPLTETGVNTGIFAACIPASSAVPGAPNNGTLYAPTGSALTVTYVDDDDPSDTSNDIATVPAAGPSVSIAKSLLDPADGTANVGDTVQFRLVVTNTGNSTLNTVTVTDSFPIACLTYDAAAPAPTTVAGNTITWNNVGPLGVGASTVLTVDFDATGSCVPGTNSASVSGSASAGPVTANVTVTGPSVDVTKTRVTGSPANIGSTVTFTIDILNDGDTVVDVLPLADNYSTCLQFQSSVPAADGAGGGTAVWNDLLPGAATLAPAATTSVTVNFTVVDACNPALNVADVSFAVDVNGDPILPDSGSDTVETLAASIRGQVRNDADADGDLADPDAGVANSLVYLYTDPNGDGDPADGTLVAVDSTDGNGDYEFTGLGLGSYVVVVEQPDQYFSTADTYGVNDRRVSVSVVAITDYPNNDFLISNYQAAFVNGVIYEDVDGDGNYDSGIDIPQAGVDVVITDYRGVVHLVTTNVNGFFSHAVPAGMVTIDVDEGTILGIVSPTLTTDVLGEGNDATVVYAPAGGVALDNTGYVSSPSTGTVEGTVYIDVDADGVYTPGTDEPLFGERVTITDVNGGVYYVTTDANGFFSQVVAAGPATVDIDDAMLPDGSVLTVGSTDPTPVVVPDGGTAVDDTGYVMPATSGLVEGTVYIDNDLSGTFTPGDTPLEGVIVDIYCSAGHIHTVTTNAAGYFSRPVPAGATTVDIEELSLPSNVTLTSNAFGEGADSNIVVVPSGGVATDNTGYVFAPSFGVVEGTVYEDFDGNGDWTPGTDTPLSAVEVTITDANGGVYTVLTDGNGFFSRVVPPGATTVDVVDATLPSGAVIDSGSTDPTVVVVPSGGVAVDDTGYTVPAGYGYVDGTIFLDDNGNGLFDAGDYVMPNVAVDITDSLGNVSRVYTDLLGYFIWPVPPGVTTVDVVTATLPPNATLTDNSFGQGSDATTVTVPSGGVATDNTGYVLASSVGYVDGRIFIDLDGDGVYTFGTDTPLPGVDVEITDVNGGVITVTTDATGYFLHPVPAGNATVDVVDATLPPDVTGLAVGNTDPTPVVVPGAGIVTDNTGYVGGGTIEGVVFGDIDNDGIYTAGIDVPFPGVDVVVTDSVGNVYNLTTAGDGSFSQAVAAGLAGVDVVDATLPAGATLGFGSTDPTAVVVPVGGTGRDDTGYIDFQTSAVAGRVYEDVNGNGTYDAGIDVPQAGADVFVTDVDGVVYALVTDADGLFSQIVPPGNTTIDVDAGTLAGIVNPTLTTDAFGEGSDATVVYAPAGGVAYDNTGYVSSPAVGTVDGTVYVDVDLDGNYTPGTDIPLSGVAVTITDVNGGVYVVVTDPSGYFSQTLPAGAATVDVDDADLPAGVTLDSGSSDPTAVVVPNGGTVTDDTGYVLPAGFGLVDGTVYIDVDSSGTFSVGDTPLAGVDVVVTDANGASYVVTTDVNGYFQQPVPAGSTEVDIVDATLPAGATLTSNAGGQGSDATVVTVPPGGVATDNTGYVLPAAVGTVDGTVYVDVDLDGNYTPGIDTPLSGVSVTVTDVNGGVYNLTTDGDGYFGATVPAGATTVDVVDATLPAGASLDGGSTDPTVVNVPDGGTATDDTGYVLPAGTGAVNGTIFLDNNGNGLFGAGDTVLPGVEVTITDSLGGVHTAITNAFGYFEWPVPAGATTVDVVDASLPSGTTLTTNVGGQGSDPTVVTVPNGGSATDNTGYLLPAAIGTVDGTIYLDVDGNDAWTPGVDMPLPGVDVTITDANGGVYTVTTDSDGYFSQVVPAGATTVDVVDAGLPPGAMLDGGSSDATVVNVPDGGTATDNTGYVQMGTVQGTVFRDQDGDGVYTAGVDTPLQGVQVTITDALGGVYSRTTNASGFFSQLVPAGNTTVDVVDATIPPGLGLAAGSSAPSVVAVPVNGIGVDNNGYSLLVVPTNTPTPTHTFTPTPTITPTPTFTPTPLPCNLWLQKGHVGAMTVGQTGTYNFTITNLGNGPTAGVVTLTDTLPAGLTFVSGGGGGWACAAAGQTVTCNSNGVIAPGGVASLSILVAVGQAAYPTVTNVASVSVANDSNLGNNSDSDPTTIRQGAQSPTATAPPATPTATPTAAPGTPTPTAPGGATATATPTHAGAATPSPTPYIDIALVKSNTGSFTQCSDGTFWYEVRNMGNSASVATAGPITVTDVLPPSLSYRGFSGTGWSCSAAGQEVTCIYPASLGVNERAHLEVTVYVGEDAYPTIISGATVSTPFDSNPENDYEQDNNVVRLGDCPAGPATPTPTAAGGAATPTPTRTGGATPTPSATPAGGNIPAGCELDVSTRYLGVPQAGGNVEYRLTWSHSCRNALDIVAAQVLPAGMEVVTVDVRSGQVAVGAGTVTITQDDQPAGVTTAVIQARILPTVAPDTVLCSAAFAEDSYGRVVESEACLTVLGGGEQLRTELHAHLLAKPGRELSYTARYFGVEPDNRLALVIPDGVTVLDIQPPLPDSVEGRVMTWYDLPAPSGKVRFTVQLDYDLEPGTVLTTLMDFEDTVGREFQQHETLVIDESSPSGDSTIGQFVLIGPRSIGAGQDVKLTLRYKKIADTGSVYLALPPELAVLDTIPPATAGVGGTLAWTIPGSATMPATGSLKVKARVAADAAPGSVLASYASLTTSTAAAEAESLTVVKNVQRRNPSSVTITAPRKVVPGLLTQLNVQVKKMPAPVTVEVAMPPQVSVVSTLPAAEVTETGKLRWTFAGDAGALLSAKPKVKFVPTADAAALGSLSVTAVTSSPAGSVVSSAVMEVREASASSGGSTGGTAKSSLAITGGTSLPAGTWTTLKVKYSGLASAGRLELALPPTLGPVEQTVPTATLAEAGRLEWQGLPAPSGSVAVKVMVHPDATPGQLVTIEGVLTDAAGVATTATFGTAVR